MILIWLILHVFYLLHLQNTLKEIEQSIRQVPPSNVWLMFIPIYNLIYPFILYPRISDSIKAEFEQRGLNSSGDFGKSKGKALAILSLSFMFLMIFDFFGHVIISYFIENSLENFTLIMGISWGLTLLKVMLGLGNLTLLLLFWSETLGFKNQLRGTQPYLKNSNTLIVNDQLDEYPLAVKINPSLKVWLIVTTCIFGGLAILSIPILPFTVMIFDAPGSSNQIGLNLVAFGFLSFPLATIIGIIVGWTTAKIAPSISKVFSVLPFLSIFIFIIGILLWG